MNKVFTRDAVEILTIQHVYHTFRNKLFYRKIIQDTTNTKKSK